MTRPTRAFIDSSALLHNLQRVKSLVNNKDIIAMVKANAYGCGLSQIIPVLDGKVWAFGVASIEEALMLKNFGTKSRCILFQGIFTKDELHDVIKHDFQCVIHNHNQLQMFLNYQGEYKFKVWVKVDTSMHRLGFEPQEVPDVITQLQACSSIDTTIGVMTHLACADKKDDPINNTQLEIFNNLNLPKGNYLFSVANSAAIISNEKTHKDIVRPGIMLYGISPFAELSGSQLGLKPVMHFNSAISNVHRYPKNSRIGYGCTWVAQRESLIAVVPVGYGDGYPRHIKDAYVYVKNMRAPIVGRVSMDMLSIDVTDCEDVSIGDSVELWGENIAIEEVAKASGTIAYELICQISPRVRKVT